MELSRILLNCVKNISNCNAWRHYSTVIKKELTVQTFCDINVDVPYNVHIKPLDVFEYVNSDKLNVELVGIDSHHNTVKHIQDGNNIKIFAGIQEYNENITCNIHVPIKANLHVKTKGNISAGFCNGSKLILKSTNGSIFVDKYHGDKIDLSTEVGDITLKGAVIAADITANIFKSGSIKTKRLQGLNAHLKTEQGNICVDASYCDNSTFETNSGNLELQNIHKNNKLCMKNGTLHLNGLDGQLDAELQNTIADIQISRIIADSKIVIKQSDKMILRLSEDCQENTMFEIVSKNHIVDPAVKLIPSKNDTTLYLMPTADNYKSVKIECPEGQVHILSASWMNMLKLNIKE